MSPEAPLIQTPTFWAGLPRFGASGESIAGEIGADEVAQNEIPGGKHVEELDARLAIAGDDVPVGRARAADQVVGRVVDEDAGPVSGGPAAGSTTWPAAFRPIRLPWTTLLMPPAGLRADELDSDVEVARDDVARAGDGAADHLVRWRPG